jgi:hypothetical protein
VKVKVLSAEYRLFSSFLSFSTKYLSIIFVFLVVSGTCQPCDLADTFLITTAPHATLTTAAPPRRV